MALQISQNPHVKNPKELSRKLIAARKQLLGDSDTMDAMPEKDAMLKLKQILPVKQKGGSHA